MVKDDKFEPIRPAKTIIASARFGLVRFVAMKNPACYEYLMPVFQSLMTYPELKAQLVKDCKTNGVNYDLMMKNINLFRAKYSAIHEMESQIEKMTHFQSGYQKQYRQIIQDEIPRICVGLPAINDSILFATISLIKNTSIAHIALPPQEIAQVVQGKGQFKMNQSRTFGELELAGGNPGLTNSGSED